MQQRQRVGDLEEEMELLHKQLRTTQLKVVEQVKSGMQQYEYTIFCSVKSQEIGNLKATKDVYDAQLAIFSDELLNTQVSAHHPWHAQTTQGYSFFSG